MKRLLAIAFILGFAGGALAAFFDDEHRAPYPLASIVYPNVLFAPSVKSADAPNSYAVGQGLPYVHQLCDSAASAGVVFSGQYLCFRGIDGGASGSFTPRIVLNTGTMTSASLPVCPNGLNCDPIAGQRQTVNAWWGWPVNTVVDAGDMAGNSFLTCIHGMWPDAVTANSAGPTKGNNAAGQKQYEFRINANRFQVDVVATGGGVTTATSPVTLVSGAWHVGCAFYESLGANVSKLTAYADGVPGTTITNAVGPIATLNTQPNLWLTAGYSTQPAAVIEGVLVTASSMTTAQASAAVATLSHLTLADQPTFALNGDWSQPMNFVHASAYIADQDPGDGGLYGDFGSIEPVNRPSIRGGGVRMTYREHGYITRASEFTNAAWTCDEVATADQAFTMFGTKAADQLNDTSAVALRCCSQSVSAVGIVKYAVSARLQAGTATGATVSMTGSNADGGANSSGDCSVTTATLTGAPARYGCLSPAAYAAGLSALTMKVCVGTVPGDTGTIFASTANLLAVYGGVTDMQGLGREYETTTASIDIFEDADTPSGIDAGTFTSTGSASVTMRPMWTSTPLGAGFIGTGGSSRMIYAVGSTLYTYDGLNNPNFAIVMDGGWKQFDNRWDGGTMVMRNVTDGQQVSSSFDGTMFTPTATAPAFRIGGFEGVGPCDCTIKGVAADPNPTKALGTW